MEIVDCNASSAKEKKLGLFAKLLLKNNALFPGTKKEVVISEGIAECQQKIEDLTLLVRELMQQQQALVAEIHELKTGISDIRTRAIAHYTTARNAAGYEKAIKKLGIV